MARAPGQHAAARHSHDTGRFATNAAPGAIPVAVGLMVTLPGLPVVYAGDEFGLTGAEGEDSRTPIPWGTEGEPDVAERLALYRDLVALRRAHPALATGGLRWIHVDDGRRVRARVGGRDPARAGGEGRRGCRDPRGCAACRCGRRGGVRRRHARGGRRRLGAAFGRRARVRGLAAGRRGGSGLVA
ncbi:alpha-amylase family glycosyl hydrolase [Microbacterium atlanticum]|uniref:alpha-amylase family glycosyl hydrolase n=1 Tax=Microbacterium atlanticum TaxID=2782168 RepID=UPI003080FD3F